MTNEYCRLKIYEILIFKSNFKDSIIKYSQSLLYIFGFILIASGSVHLAISDSAPEKAYDEPPDSMQASNGELGDRNTSPAEGATTFNNEILATSIALPLVTFAAEGATALPAEVSVSLPPEQTIIEAQNPDLLEPNYDDSLPRFATGNLLWFIEGPFGALIMVSAGIGAIIAGAFGGYKAAITLLFVALGAFVLRALVSLFFGTNYQAYSVDFAGEGLR